MYIYIYMIWKERVNWNKMQFEKNFSLRRIEFFEILINRGVETFASRNTRFRLCYASFLVYPKRKGKKKKNFNFRENFSNSNEHKHRVEKTGYPPVWNEICIRLSLSKLQRGNGNFLRNELHREIIYCWLNKFFKC